MAFWVLLVPAALVAAALVVGVIVLIAKAGKKGALVLLACLAAVVLLAMLWFASIRVEQARRVRAVARVREAPARVRTEASFAPDRSPFLADLYPSAELAARALATDLAGAIDAIGPRGSADVVVRVAGTAPADLLDEVAETFRRRASGAKAVVTATAPAATTAPATKTDITCTVQADAGDEGSVKLALAGPMGTASRTVKFIRKDWAASFDRFVSASAGRQWLLAHSPSPCATPREANKAALEHAADQLAGRVREALSSEIRRGRLPRHAMARAHELRSIIQAELSEGKLIVDRFAQRFSRPYGDVWKQALLIELTGSAVGDLARKAGHDAAAGHAVAAAGRLRAGLSLVAVALAVLLGYLLLNAATKGYYVWPLRLVAVGLLAGGAILVLMVA